MPIWRALVNAMNSMHSKARRVAVIDDHYAKEASQDEVLYDRQHFLADCAQTGTDFEFCTAAIEGEDRYSAEVVLEFLEAMSSPPSSLLLDIRFGDQELLGLDILREISARFPSIPVIMMTSSPRGELWLACVALGAVDYLVKPLQPAILKEVLDRYSEPDPQYWLIGQNDLFLGAVDQVALAAEGGMSSVLLLGEAGTGKEVFARYLHRHGPRWAGPFQAVHIPSISEHLLEAELFGYSRGAFTGALRDEPGRLIKANGGVLFLDEVGDLTSTAQAALLRVLETREVSRLGDGRLTRIDVQVVAATNSNLAQRVKANTFRLDLYSRLAGTAVHLPALADRIDDIDLLMRHMQRRAYRERGLRYPFFELPFSLLSHVRARHWRGNVRDIWNFVQRALDAARGEMPSVDSYQKALPPLDVSDLAEDRSAAGSRQLQLSLQKIALETVRNPTSFIRDLTLQELSLLNSALEVTRDPVSNAPNRAGAAALLKQRRKCSTNDFDRWVARLVERLSLDDVETLRGAYPDLLCGDLPVRKRGT